MVPPIYAVCAADTSVTTLLIDSSGRLRLFPAGEAPQAESRPYAVWNIIYGGPENCITDAPNADMFGIQIDVYGPTRDSVIAIATAIRNAVQIPAHVVRYNGESREAGTRADRHWRYSFDVEWMLIRA